jgi:hypothetical protein
MKKGSCLATKLLLYRRSTRLSINAITALAFGHQTSGAAIRHCEKSAQNAYAPAGRRAL